MNDTRIHGSGTYAVTATTTTRERLISAGIAELLRQGSDDYATAIGFEPQMVMVYDGVIDVGTLIDAILAELRNPDEAMVLSGAVDYAITSDIRVAWRGMIDVAMTGAPSKTDNTA